MRYRGQVLARASKFQMAAGETLLASFRVNRTQGNRTVGGHLYLTNRRLLFLPHWMDASTGGQEWGVALADVASADVAPRGHGLFDGSIRARLRVTTTRGVEHFVVPRVSKVAARIEEVRRA
jgi:GRAM domain